MSLQSSEHSSALVLVKIGTHVTLTIHAFFFFFVCRETRQISLEFTQQNKLHDYLEKLTLFGKGGREEKRREEKARSKVGRSGGVNSDAFHGPTILVSAQLGRKYQERIEIYFLGPPL